MNTLQPFAGQLRELRASDESALGDAELAEATQLVMLDASFNSHVTGSIEWRR